MQTTENKPALKGPFYLFALDFRRREEHKGKSFSSGTEQMMQEAKTAWKLLSEAERQVYKDQTSTYRKPKQKRGSLSKVESEQRKHKKKQLTIDKAISEMIQNGMRKNVLQKLEMFLISVNHFCMTSARVYVPAELAIVRYSLENGIIANLHELMNPMQLPLGLAHEANQHSKETHELPIPPNALGETNFGAVLQRVLAFTGYNKPQKLFPLLTNSKEVAIVESVLNQLNKESEIKYQFLVIPLEEFFFHLKRGTEKYGLDISASQDRDLVESLLKNDNLYEYTSELACDFHKKLGNLKFCALSKVSRWTYGISAHCCPDMGIDLIAGCHFPTKIDTLHLSDHNMSGTILSQLDALSMTSRSSTQSRSKLPQMQARKEVQNETADPVEPMNSFYMVDSVYGSSLPMYNGGNGLRAKHTKLIPVRQPSSGRGRGMLLQESNRSPDIDGASREQSLQDYPPSTKLCAKGMAKGRREWPCDNSFSLALQGTGRSQNHPVSGPTSGSRTRGRGTTRRQLSTRMTSTYRQPYSSDVKGSGTDREESLPDNALVRRLNVTGIAKGRGELLADNSCGSILCGAGRGNGIYAEPALSIETCAFVGDDGH